MTFESMVFLKKVSDVQWRYASVAIRMAAIMLPQKN